MRKHYFIALAAMCSMLALLPASLIAAGPPTVGVNVLNTPNVTVTNPLSSPIPVKDVNNPAKTPFTGDGTGSFNLNFINMQLSVGTFPTGKRLVIEQVTAQCVMDSDDNIYNVAIGVVKNLVEGWSQIYVPLLVQKAGLTWEGKAVFTVSQQVSLYSDAISTGGSIFMDFRHSKTASVGDCKGYVSGYLVDPSSAIY